MTAAALTITTITAGPPTTAVRDVLLTAAGLIGDHGWIRHRVDPDRPELSIDAALRWVIYGSPEPIHALPHLTADQMTLHTAALIALGVHLGVPGHVWDIEYCPDGDTARAVLMATADHLETR